jgi:hypothetical protein
MVARWIMSLKDEGHAGNGPYVYGDARRKEQFYILRTLKTSITKKECTKLPKKTLSVEGLFLGPVAGSSSLGDPQTKTALTSRRALI